MKKNFPEDEKLVVVEFEDLWMRKNELLFAIRRSDKWLDMRSGRPLLENKSCQVLRWQSVITKSSAQLGQPRREHDVSGAVPFYGLKEFMIECHKAR